MGSDERRTSYETPPSHVGRTHGDAWAGAIALGVVALVALAVLKPWASVSPGPLDASPALGTPSLTPAPSSSIAPAPLDGAAVGPTALAVRAAGALSRQVGRIGRWGVAGAGAGDGAGDPGSGTSDAATWTSWVPATPGRPSGPLDGVTTCRSGPRLPPGPLVLAVSAPAGVRPDWVPDVWRVLDDGPAEFPALRRLPADVAARSGLSALAFTDGSPWPDGVYRIDVWSGPEKLSIDLCVGDGLAATRRTSPRLPVVASETSPEAAAEIDRAPARPTPVPPGGDPLFGPLVARLAAHSGTWGIGSGGWGISPVSGSPWAAWTASDPVIDSGDGRSPPSCESLDWLRAGIVVAVTVPRDVPPDWTIGVTRFAEDGSALGAPGVTQVSPAGNRGIAYLVRPRDETWPQGAYRFTVRTGTTAVALDACLLPL